MKDILTEDLLNSLRLIKYDRSKTLLENNIISEQITAYERYLDKKYSKVPEKTTPPPTPKKYSGGPPYEVLKKYPTTENIALIIMDSDNYFDDDEAWAEAAFNSIKDKKQYWDVSMKMGEDPYEFISDFMDTKKKYNSSNTYKSVYNKFVSLGNPNLYKDAFKKPTAEAIANILYKADSGFLGTDNEKLAQQAFNSIVDKKMYIEVGDRLNQDPYDFCDDILSVDKNYGVGKTVSQKFKSLNTQKWHYEVLKTGNPINVARILLNSDKGLFGNDKEAWAHKAFMSITDWDSYLMVKELMGDEDPLQFCLEMFTTLVSRSSATRYNISQYYKDVKNHYSKIFAYDRMKNNPIPETIVEVINAGLGETMEKRKFRNTYEAWVQSAFDAIKTRDMYNDVNMVFSRVKRKEVDVYQLIKKEMSGDPEMTSITKRYNELIKQKLTEKPGDIIESKNLNSEKEKIENMSQSFYRYSIGTGFIDYNTCKSVNQLYAAYSLNILKASTMYMSNKIYIGLRDCTEVNITRLGGTGSGNYMQSFDLSDLGAYSQLLNKIIDNKGIENAQDRTMGNTFVLSDFYYNWGKIVEDYNKTFNKNPNANKSYLFPNGWFNFLNFWFNDDKWSNIKNEIDKGLKDPLQCSGGKIKTYGRSTSEDKKMIISTLHVALPLLSMLATMALTPAAGYLVGYGAQVLIEMTDAAIYLHEGDEYSAGLAALFALVPFDFIVDKVSPLRGMAIPKAKNIVLDMISKVAKGITEGTGKGKGGLMKHGLTQTQIDILNRIGKLTKGFQREMLQTVLVRLIGSKMQRLSAKGLIKFLWWLSKKGYVTTAFLAKVGIPVGGILYYYDDIRKFLGLKTKEELEKEKSKVKTPEVKKIEPKKTEDLCNMIISYFQEAKNRKIVLSRKKHESYFNTPVMLLQLFLVKYTGNKNLKFKWGYYDKLTYDEVYKLQEKTIKGSGDGVIGDKTWTTLLGLAKSKKYCPIVNNTGVNLLSVSKEEVLSPTIEKEIKKEPTTKEVEDAINKEKQRLTKKITDEAANALKEKAHDPTKTDTDNIVEFSEGEFY